MVDASKGARVVDLSHLTYGGSMSLTITPNGTGSGWMGPMVPLAPVAPPQVAGRQFDVRMGYNLQINPRSDDSVSFWRLRQLADSYDLLRIIIESRKDQVERINIKFRAKEGTKVPDASVDKISAFFERPDGEHDLKTWLRMLLEDLFVIDAPCLYRQRDLAGNLLYLLPMDGGTIKRIIDDWGRTPMPYQDPQTGDIVVPPAYQQILKGMQAVNYSVRDLIYAPRNIRTNRVYGFSPVEQLLMTVQIALRRQLSTSEYYTEGNIPAALIGVPDNWTPDMIKQFQDYWDTTFEGDTAKRRKAKFVPGGVAKTFIATREPELKNVFDEWLARVCCYAFSVSPQGFVSQTNRATANTQKEMAEEQGLYPILMWIKKLIDPIIAFDLGEPNIEMVIGDDEEIDPVQQMTVLTNLTNNATITRNEAREKLGMEISDTPEANLLGFTTPNGFVPLDQQAVLDQQQAVQDIQQPDPTVTDTSSGGGQGGGQGGVQKTFDPSEARDEKGRWSADTAVFVHGGRDFDSPDLKYAGTGEPGGIRPLGSGLYGALATAPEHVEKAVALANIYARKYGGTLHAFALKVPGHTFGKVAQSHEEYPQKHTRGGVGADTGVLKFGLPIRQVEFETLPHHGVEAAVHDVSLLTRLGKWPALHTSEDIAKSVPRIAGSILSTMSSIAKSFDPDEPRDEKGKWTSGGSSGKKPGDDQDRDSYGRFRPTGEKTARQRRKEERKQSSADQFARDEMGRFRAGKPDLKSTGSKIAFKIGAAAVVLGAGMLAMKFLKPGTPLSAAVQEESMRFAKSFVKDAADHAFTTAFKFAGLDSKTSKLMAGVVVRRLLSSIWGGSVGKLDESHADTELASQIAAYIVPPYLQRVSRMLVTSLEEQGADPDRLAEFRTALSTEVGQVCQYMQSLAKSDVEQSLAKSLKKIDPVWPERHYTEQHAAVKSKVAAALSASADGVRRLVLSRVPAAKLAKIDVHAAGVAFSTPDGKMLFLRRAGGSDSDSGGTWAFPGGSLEEGEDHRQAVMRESAEEIGRIPDMSTLEHLHTGSNGYQTFTASADEEFEPRLNDEHDAHVWSDPSDPPFPLHPGVQETLAALGHIEKLAKAEDDDTAAGIARDASLNSVRSIRIGDDLAGVSGDSAQRILVRMGVVSNDAVDEATSAAEGLSQNRADAIVAPTASGDDGYSVEQSTRDIIQSAVQAGLDRGDTPEEIADSVQSRALSDDRAEGIADYEVSNASTAGTLEAMRAAQDAGLQVYKSWLTADDDRVDEDICRANEAQGPIPLEDKFQSGHMAPLGHPRCRCALVPHVMSAEDTTDE